MVLPPLFLGQPASGGELERADALSVPRPDAPCTAAQASGQQGSPSVLDPRRIVILLGGTAVISQNIEGEIIKLVPGMRD